ncbi:MAG: DUF5660 family protein [Candidatus Shapirobacteria bacterium]|jgi:hypothetical protein
MAGGYLLKPSTNKTGNYKVNGFSNEIIKGDRDEAPKKKTGLMGILGLGQSVEISKPKLSWGNEFLGGVSHLQQEENLLLKNQQTELKKTIESLQQEIKKLIKATDSLNTDVEKIALEPIVEVSEYQLHFLDRVKIFIANLRKNLSQASTWLESFQSKKRKKNAFWSKVKNKKEGGEQYLFSGEHSAARSTS